MIEIERKFLVDLTKLTPFISVNDIKQGYLNLDPERTVRVRLLKDRGTLTVKGISSDNGLSRFEWERDIYANEAEELLKICVGVIDKTRCVIKHDNMYWEIDFFHGDNKGLVVAEVELSSVDQQITLPPFVKTEVTGQEKYYNSHLTKNPFKNW
mgnify:CR=1 FL=1